jgi:hypothetical protein
MICLLTETTLNYCYEWSGWTLALRLFIIIDKGEPNQSVRNSVFYKHWISLMPIGKICFLKWMIYIWWSEKWRGRQLVLLFCLWQFRYHWYRNYYFLRFLLQCIRYDHNRSYFLYQRLIKLKANCEEDKNAALIFLTNVFFPFCL